LRASRKTCLKTRCLHHVEVLPAHASKRRDVQSAEQAEVVHADGVLRIAAPGAQESAAVSLRSVEAHPEAVPAHEPVHAAVRAHQRLPVAPWPCDQFAVAWQVASVGLLHGG
jgi:hypothetical protein